MLSGFIFFRKAHVSLVKRILEKVTRYQDQALRKKPIASTHEQLF